MSQRTEAFNYPPPDNAAAEIESLQNFTQERAAAAQLTDTTEPRETTKQVIRDLMEINERASNLAINMTLYAISEGTLSQPKAAELLGTHQQSVHRWVKSARAGKPVGRPKRFKQQPEQPE